MKWFCLGILLVCTTTLTGCLFHSPVVPPFGNGFNQTTAPVDITFAGQSIGDRTGEASSESILSLFSWGDSSIHAAARNGGLTSVDHVDCEILNVLGIYVRYTTIATGR